MLHDGEYVCLQSEFRVHPGDIRGENPGSGTMIGNPEAGGYGAGAVCLAYHGEVDPARGFGLRFWVGQVDA